MLVVVLDGLETHHHVNGVVLQWQQGSRRLDEAQAIGPVAASRMGDGLGRDIYAGHRVRNARQDLAAITFATGHVHHLLAGTEPGGEVIAMEMFEGDLTGHFGHEPFAGECEIFYVLVKLGCHGSPQYMIAAEAGHPDTRSCCSTTRRTRCMGAPNNPRQMPRA